MTDAQRELERSMRDHRVDLRTITPTQWIGIFEGFAPEQTREAIGLIAQSAGMSAILRARQGLSGPQPEADQRPRRLQAKKAGRCTRCRAAIAIGESIIWQADTGAWHERCGREGSR